MFGDGSWIEAREASQSAKLQTWLKTVIKPVIIEIGAGVDLPSVRCFSQRIYQQFDGFLVRINLDELASTPHNESSVTIHASALDALRDLEGMVNI